MTTRRDFLKGSLSGSLLLGVGACTRKGSSDARGDVLQAIIPVMLNGALPVETKARHAAIRQTQRGVETAIAGLIPAVQEELADLFSLLSFAPTRMLAAGLSAPWPEAPPEAVGRFLESWRHSRIMLFRSAYAALHDLVFGAWYAQPESWPAIGYPGPPKVPS